jgi:hypothetical protein
MTPEEIQKAKDELATRKKAHYEMISGLKKEENIQLPAPPEQNSILMPVKNFTKSMITWAENGFQRVSQEVFDKRIGICRTCEFWEEKGNLGMGKCLKCGCGRGKHWLLHEQCPIGLWGKEE